jgi:hypothetical protein
MTMPLPPNRVLEATNFRFGKNDAALVQYRNSDEYVTI